MRCNQRFNVESKMKSILDNSFHYTPSIRTDLRKTFAKIRRQQRDSKVADTMRKELPGLNVLSINQRKIGTASH